jgi:hypothetical protein
MSSDFFLLNRAHQVNRLYGLETDKQVQKPNEKNLARMPDAVRYFYALLDRVCAVAQVESVGEGATLTEAQRKAILEFEEVTVLNRFAADETVKETAVQMIKAIFADAAYFSGLKPLPQYTEKFAYELLFPSWLNLLSAVMLPRTSGTPGQARLDGQHQVEFFRYVAACPVVNGTMGQNYVGFLTFLASRHDAPLCEQMLQRMIELIGRHGEAIVQTLSKIDQATADGTTLKDRFTNYLIVKYSQEEWDTPEYWISQERPQTRPLPLAIRDKLDSLETSENTEAYCNLLTNVATVVLSKQPISIDLTTAMHKRPAWIEHLLQWTVKQHNPPKLITESSQSLLGFVATVEETNGDATQSTRMENFVKRIIDRAGNIGEKATDFFRGQFLAGEENRKTLLDACDSELKLKKFAAMLLDHAGKTENTEKFINLLSCASVLDQTDIGLAAQISLNALQSVIDNRSIGNKELADIMGDMQKNVGTAMATLASPLSVAAEKTERLITLYLALNEVGQTLLHSGKVDNFSVVRAKYSRLSQME